MKTEALKQALEALEYRGGSTWLKRGIAVEAIKEALAQPQQSCYCLNCEALGKELAALKAQPQQKPVATTLANHVTSEIGYCKFHAALPSGTNLYTSPPQRKPLTDEKFLELMLQTGTQELIGIATFVGDSIQMQGKIGLLRSAKIIKEFVEATHGIKENT